MLVLWLWSIKLLALAHLATAPKVISDDLRWRVVWMYVDDNMTYEQIGQMQRLSPKLGRCGAWYSTLYKSICTSRNINS